MNHRKNKTTVCYWGFLLTAGLLSFGCNNKSDHTGHEEMWRMDHLMRSMPNPEINNKDTIDLSMISLPTNYSVISSQRTTRPLWSESNVVISVNGYIAADERRDNKISARFSGRIEKLFVKYQFQYVEKGERIMDIYSAELNTIQEELLFLLKSKSEIELVKKAEEKLLLMGISDSQLKEIESTGKALRSMSLLSPYGGYVYFANVNVSPLQMPGRQSSQMGGIEMSDNSLSNREMNTSSLQIHEGAYVSKGQTLFRVNDLKEVIGMVLIDNNHPAALSVGTEVGLTSELNKDNVIKARIDLLEPVIQNGQKFLSARAYLKNEAGLLKISSLLTAKINSVKIKKLLIPTGSILSLGSRNIVWVKIGEAGKGKYIFQVRDITTGVSQGSTTEVIGGLTDKEEIALSAGYLIDRESIIELK